MYYTICTACQYTVQYRACPVYGRTERETLRDVAKGNEGSILHVCAVRCHAILCHATYTASCCTTQEDVSYDMARDIQHCKTLYTVMQKAIAYRTTSQHHVNRKCCVGVWVIIHSKNDKVPRLPDATDRRGEREREAARFCFSRDVTKLSLSEVKPLSPEPKLERGTLAQVGADHSIAAQPIIAE